jgi:hypothetical protein
MFKRLRRRHDAGHTAPPDPARLDVCTRCGSDYVHPVEWSERGGEHWWMLLRCGACEAEREVTVANAVADRFDRDLVAAERAIKRAVARLDAVRMAGDVEVFAAALERDLIGPSDFGR